MKRNLAATLFGTALVVSTAASAATLEPVTGSASVKIGDGFQAITSPVKVEPGDTIMVSPNGSAKIVYAEGCWIEVEPAAVVVVPEVPNCGSGGAVQGHLGVTADDDDRGLAYEHVVLAGVIIGGGILAGIAFTGGDNNKKIAAPASP